METEVRKKKKSASKIKVSYKIDDGVVSKLDEISEKSGVTKSRLVERALIELFEKIEKEGAIRI